MLWWCYGTPGEGIPTPQVMSWWILTLGVLLVWVRWLKKPMNSLASWRSLEEALGPTLDGLKVNSSCTLDEDDVVIDKDLEPLMIPLMPLVWSWSPLLALDMVRWHDEGTHTHMMAVWPLDTLMMILVLLKVGWRCWHLMNLKMMTLGHLLRAYYTLGVDDMVDTLWTLMIWKINNN